MRQEILQRIAADNGFYLCTVESHTSQNLLAQPWEELQVVKGSDNALQRTEHATETCALALGVRFVEERCTHRAATA